MKPIPRFRVQDRGYDAELVWRVSRRVRRKNVCDVQEGSVDGRRARDNRRFVGPQESDAVVSRKDQKHDRRDGHRAERDRVRVAVAFAEKNRVRTGHGQVLQRVCVRMACQRFNTRFVQDDPLRQHGGRVFRIRRRQRREVSTTRPPANDFEPLLPLNKAITERKFPGGGQVF